MVRSEGTDTFNFEKQIDVCQTQQNVDCRIWVKKCISTQRLLQFCEILHNKMGTSQ